MPTPDKARIIEKAARAMIAPLNFDHQSADWRISYKTMAEQLLTAVGFFELLEAVEPLAEIAPLLPHREDDNTLISACAAPRKWKHIKASDLRRAAAVRQKIMEGAAPCR